MDAARNYYTLGYFVPPGNDITICVKIKILAHTLKDEDEATLADSRDEALGPKDVSDPDLPDDATLADSRDKVLRPRDVADPDLPLYETVANAPPNPYLDSIKGWPHPCLF